jgi:putative transposase
MVSPAQRRVAVRWAREAFHVSERRACRVLRVSRRLVWYRSRRPEEAALRRRLRELAATRVAYGSRRLHILLRRDGLRVNYKKVHRLYVEEGLQLKPRRRRRAATQRMHRAAVTAGNQRWAMDFMQDVLRTGAKVRVFTLIDVWRRECVALRVATKFTGSDVAPMLSEVHRERGALPAVIQCDNGTEFTSTALDRWAYWNRVQLDFRRPGKPVDNSLCEAFNGSLRRECLSQYWFASLDEAATILRTWQLEYNNHRPHSSLGLEPPAFRAVMWFSSGNYFLLNTNNSRPASTLPPPPECVTESDIVLESAPRVNRSTVAYELSNAGRRVVTTSVKSSQPALAVAFAVTSPVLTMVLAREPSNPNLFTEASCSTDPKKPVRCMLMYAGACVIATTIVTCTVPCEPTRAVVSNVQRPDKSGNALVDPRTECSAS